MAKRTTKKDESPVLAALRFVSLAQQAEGTAPYQSHCRFMNGQLVAFNGILAAGIAVEADFEINPNTFHLIKALERATDNHSVSLLDSGSLVVTTRKLRVVVPCIDQAGLPFITGDPKQYPLNDNFRIAATAALTFTAEGATTIAYAAGITRDGSIVGTDGRVFIEAWHGIPTPPGLILPKQFFKALEKVQKSIVGFGFSNASFTVYFDDQSWLRTQLYLNETMPNFDNVFAWCDAGIYDEIPKDWYTAIEAVAPFSPNGRFHVEDDAISSHGVEGLGATYKFKGIEPAGQFVAQQFTSMKNYLTKIDLRSNERAVLFLGKTGDIMIRGAIAKITG